VTRLPYTPEHRAALAVLTDLMEQAGLDVTLDSAGTLIGRQAGPARAPVLLLGSHQDSVREGGAYDGIMGVVLPVLALMKLRAAGVHLPFAVEVLAFADEEGVRFPAALTGPRALAGTFDAATLDLCDRDGTSLRAAMQGFGLNPDALSGLRRDPAQVLGWIECHLEQGPVLENAGERLGVVTAICGIERHAVTLTGAAAHAGTQPMDLRRDALATAAELVLAVERAARAQDDLLANVGALQVRPGVVNAVPGEVRMMMEFRSPVDEVRQAAGRALVAEAQAIAARRSVGVQVVSPYEQAATPCATAMQRALARAVRDTGGAGLHLASGATHDTSPMADLCPVGMIFTACRDGLSHNPAEFVAPEAMRDCVDALARALVLLGEERAAA